MRINKLLAIAIDEYDNEDLNKIDNCLTDIKSIVGLLTSKYLFDDIEVIEGRENTNRKNLLHKLSAYFSNTLSDENVLLLYAGHGEYNESLQTSYWQPSNADPKDFSTWVNINELLGFIKASKAFHVNLISDSCFSGAIFQNPTRGGGVEAFNSKKSRLALTSGGIEKVSDGKKGALSPFADILVKILNENTASELPFNVLANNVILSFSKERKQTPMFGSLNDVGHEGGALVLKRKTAIGSEQKIEDVNHYLKEKLNHLFFEINGTDLEVINQIKPIREKKNEVVKNQRFEEAAKLRDQEKAFIQKINDGISTYIDLLFHTQKISEVNIENGKKLKAAIQEYQKAKPQRDAAHEALKKYLEEQKEESSEETEKSGIMIEPVRFTSMVTHYFDLEIDRNPEIEYFNSQRDAFVALYQDNVLKLYEYFLQISSSIESDLLFTKRNEFKKILSNIYAYEIKLVTQVNRGYDIENIIELKQLDIQLLTWIRNT